MAAETAKALVPYFDVTLIYCFEKAGVLRDENDDDSVIGRIDKASYAELKDAGVIVGGMIPKLDNSFSTLESGVKRVLITKADSLNDLNKGTKIEL